jgi:hypothetical protein
LKLRIVGDGRGDWIGDEEGERGEGVGGLVDWWPKRKEGARRSCE